MDFTLDEQQTDVRDLAVGVLARRTAEYPAAAPSGPEWFDHELWADLGRAGLLGIALPEEHGGSGAGFIDQCLLLEEVARAGVRTPLVETAVLAALPIARFGTVDQQHRLLAPFCDGTLILTSSARTDLSGSVVQAEPDGDAWRLSGVVSHVLLADVAARVLVAGDDGTGRAGWFLVDPQSPGVTLSRQSSVDRSPRWYLQLDSALVAAPDVLATPGPASAPVSRWLSDHGVAARCISQVGSSDAALKLTARYVSEREQFGRPVGTFQAVAHRVADAYIDVTAVRLTAWRAVWLLAQGEPAAEALAVAAWWAADASNRVAEAAMHLHGGLSVDLDYPLHRYFLSIKQNDLALGGPSRRLMALGDLVAVG